MNDYPLNEALKGEYLLWIKGKQHGCVSDIGQKDIWGVRGKNNSKIGPTAMSGLG